MKAASLETLEKLADIILRRKPALMEGNLLIRISNLLGERLSRGEDRAYVLREKILKQLIRYKPRFARRRS